MCECMSALYSFILLHRKDYHMAADDNDMDTTNKLVEQEQFNKEPLLCQNDENDKVMRFTVYIKSKKKE